MLADTAPDSFLDSPVPDALKTRWATWEAANWRLMQWRGSGRSHPPDERFSVRLSKEICPVHRQLWLDYRNMRFDPETGDRWPGGPGSFFDPIESDLDRVRENRRVEWDEKASDQMRRIERICLSGVSPQCGQLEESIESPPVVDIPLPEGSSA